MKKYHFFWSGIYSNWHMCKFIVPFAGMNIPLEFNCMEQYMMYSKAILFGDFYIASKIMEASHPKKQKSLGREVQNFDSKVWDEKKESIVSYGIFLKFMQNEELKEQLLNQKGDFVEVSPYDRVWGIGYLEKDALKNIDNWGENLLGKILTDCRDTIIRSEQGIVS